MKSLLVAFLAVTFVVFSGVASSAEDFSQAAALISVNAPAGADTAGMGNPWAAMPDFSSNNPAVYAAETEEKYKFCATGTYTLLGFKKGPDVSSYSLTPSVKLPVGVLKATFVKADSGKSETKMGVDMKYDTYSSINVGYGVKVADKVFGKEDKLYFGMDVTPYSKSKLSFSSEGERAAQSKSDSFSVGAGFLYQPTKGVNLGAYYNYGSSRDKEKDYFEETSSSSRSTNQLLRVGASWQVLPMTMIAADWQYVNLDGYRKGQLFAGVEQGIIKDLLYVYGGWAANGPTAGIGVYFKNGGVNLAYMAKPFKEADRYLGKSKVVTAAVYWTF